MKLGKNSWILIIINTIHTIVSLFYSTFLVAYFLNITNNNIIPAAAFYIFTYFLLMIGFILIGPLVKNGKKLLLYRSSFLVNFILLLILVYLKEDSINYIWILGIILGIEKIFYWFPQNILISEIANKNQLIKYSGYSTFFSGTAKIIMPVILGYLITLNSFISTAFVILILTFIQFVLSFFMKEKFLKQKKFNLKALYVLAMRRQKIKKLLQIEFLKGFISEVIDILVVLYVVYMFKTNLNLGIFTSVFAICAIIVDFVLGNRCNFGSFPKLLSASSIIVLMFSSFFVFETSKLSFILYNFAIATAGELIRVISEINMYKMSQDKSVVVHYRAEYLALRETILNLGRILGFGGIILVSATGSEHLLKYLILVLSGIFVLVGYLSISLTKQIARHPTCK